MVSSSDDGGHEQVSVGEMSSAGMTSAERERTVYQGGPSQVLNYNTFTVCALIFAVAIIAPGIYNNALAKQFPDYKNVYMLVSKAMFFLPLLWSFWVWLELRCHRYILTTETFQEVRGVFSRRTDILQLYRVKDMTLEQPFTLRMFGCGNIVLDTSDKTTPIVLLKAVKQPRNLMAMLSRNVEIMRTLKGVREID